HKIIYTGVKPCRSHQCEKACRQSCNLRCHEKTHPEVSPYICYKCGR
ncbi:hypothetical protein DBR06_SOUSAS44610008, partial [Sousa chinensis]